MQISRIAQSLKEITAATPVLVNALPGLIHYGARASAKAEKPFGLLVVNEIEREQNSSGVALVSYNVELTVVVDELGERVSYILEVFHRYWDRITDLPALQAETAKFILIHPTGESEIGEADNEELGKDVLLGSTSWLLKLSEHEPELGD